MQVPNSDETAAENPKQPEEESEVSNYTVEDIDTATADDDEPVLDISGKSLDFPISENSEDDVGALYLYKNVFNLLPKSIGGLKRLRTLKFFGNEINLFSSSSSVAASEDYGSLVGLECLQLKLPAGFGGLPLNKLKGLKELELSKVPPRSSLLILSEIAGLKCLTKLSVCHFSIRYLPPEFGCLNNLEYLDLSFNKMKSLPTEISNLNALISLKVANNKLVELPSALSSLQRLENLDLSNNRLMSLGSLELGLMHNLQNLNLQYNKLLNNCQIPSWICCNLEGNRKDTSNEDLSSCSMDVYDTAIQENDEILSHIGFHRSSSSLINGPSSNSRCSTIRRPGKRWKRMYNLQQIARQECLNNSRKWKCQDCYELLRMKEDGECKPSNIDFLSESCPEVALDIINLDDDKDLLSGESEIENFPENVAYRDMGSKKESYVENCSSVGLDSTAVDKGGEQDCCECDALLATNQEVVGEQDEVPPSEISKSTSNPKRHYDEIISPHGGLHHSSSGILCMRRYNLQQRARLERLNNSRKWKGHDCSELLMKEDGECKPDNIDVLSSESGPECAPDIIIRQHRSSSESCPEDEDLSLEIPKRSSKRKRDKSDVDVDNSDVDVAVDNSDVDVHVDNSNVDVDESKPCKCSKSDDSPYLSHKYSNISFCNNEDRLPDGFYDAGRNRPFMPLESYEQNFHLDSREVILVDRERDEELDAISCSAQALVSHFKQLNGLSRDGDWADELQIASLLALVVSDHFGGTDRSALVVRTRKAVSGSNYRKPFICTCSTGNSDCISLSNKPVVETVEDTVLSDLCEKSLRSIKARRNSIIVPIGTLQFGVCRHRALLFKYLCDRVEPRVPCELLRGYLDFMPHAWNIVSIKRGDLPIRMVVDACRPHDIREETDPEYYCRYIPLSRIKASLSTGSSPAPTGSFPSLCSCDETLKKSSSSIIVCKYGSVEAAAKRRTNKVYGTSVDDIRTFEYNCLGEVRILGALKHPCIVELYGHQISSEWVPSAGGSPEHRILQSAIWMEYIKGGSLKSYIGKLSKAGEKHVPVELALCIAKDVACALVELHSKHIIHRDIKSENILIDLDRKRDDGTPVVKLCDFDKAVPLRSYLHTCCIAHIGIPPANVCVGTPRWMAPEVLRAMHERNFYGLEVDIWSFGCLLLELLTLQIPYLGISELEIHDNLKMGKRPKLTDELEVFRLKNEPVMAQSGAKLEETETEADLDTLRFLVDLFCQCTEENPLDRPTADNLYELLVEHSSNLTNSKS